MGVLPFIQCMAAWIRVGNIGRSFHGEDGTNGTQGVLTFCPRFDGEYKAYVLNNKDNLRVVLSIHR